MDIKIDRDRGEELAAWLLLVLSSTETVIVGGIIGESDQDMRQMNLLRG